MAPGLSITLSDMPSKYEALIVNQTVVPAPTAELYIDIEMHPQALGRTSDHFVAYIDLLRVSSYDSQEEGEEVPVAIALQGHVLMTAYEMYGSPDPDNPMIMAKFVFPDLRITQPGYYRFRVTCYHMENPDVALPDLDELIEYGRASSAPFPIHAD